MLLLKISTVAYLLCAWNAIHNVLMNLQEKMLMYLYEILVFILSLFIISAHGLAKQSNIKLISIFKQKQ